MAEARLTPEQYQQLRQSGSLQDARELVEELRGDALASIDWQKKVEEAKGLGQCAAEAGHVWKEHACANCGKPASQILDKVLDVLRTSPTPPVPQRPG